MGMTRGNVIDRVVTIVGDTSTAFRTFLETCVNNRLYYIWEFHDWNFKHKRSTVSTAASTETYNLRTGTTDIRSARDIETLYDTTNKRFLKKCELREIKKAYPAEDATGQPTHYAVWDYTTIFLHPIPTGIYVLKFLYLAKPTVPTADANDLESVCSLPDYMQPILEQLVLGDALQAQDDSRAAGVLAMADAMLTRAMAADMKDLESTARFKYWEEEYNTTGNQTINDAFRQLLWGCD